MSKYRSRPFFGRTRGPSLRREPVAPSTATSAGVPSSAVGATPVADCAATAPLFGRDLAAMRTPRDGPADQAGRILARPDRPQRANSAATACYMIIPGRTRRPGWGLVFRRAARDETGPTPAASGHRTGGPRRD